MHLLISARDALANRRQRNRAYGELAALDDRSLADIGLHRSHIPAVVEGLHNAVQLDAAPIGVVASSHRDDFGLSPTQQWLHRV
jgi:uncharacterized protein YjiS (DUF1127 family)